MYIFDKAKKEDIEKIYALYEERVEWMNKKSIRQWNLTNYLSYYPKAYYYEQCEFGNLYILKNEDSEILGAVVLLEKDERWVNNDYKNAYYIHNLVTNVKYNGLGKIILQQIQELAINENKDSIRLDCAVDNEFLNNYYESMDYKKIDFCEEGLYKGVKREKILKQKEID